MNCFFFFFFFSCLFFFNNSLHFIGGLHLLKTAPQVMVGVRQFNCNLEVSERLTEALWQESDVDRRTARGTDQPACGPFVFQICFLLSQHSLESSPRWWVVELLVHLPGEVLFEAVSHNCQYISYMLMSKTRWRGRLPQMFFLMNHRNASQFVKKVNCWALPFVLSWTIHLASFFTITYTSPPPTRPNTRTHTPSTLRHTPTTLHVSSRRGGGRREAYKRVRDFGGRAEETSLVSKSCDQLPPTATCTFSSALLSGSLASVSCSDSRSLSQTHTHTHNFFFFFFSNISEPPAPVTVAVVRHL